MIFTSYDCFIEEWIHGATHVIILEVANPPPTPTPTTDTHQVNFKFILLYKGSQEQKPAYYIITFI